MCHPTAAGPPDIYIYIYLYIVVFVRVVLLQVVFGNILRQRERMHEAGVKERNCRSICSQEENIVLAPKTQWATEQAKANLDPLPRKISGI